MLALLQLLIYGHVHKWKTIERRTAAEDGVTIGVRFICECEKCGRIKKFNMF